MTALGWRAGAGRWRACVRTRRVRLATARGWACARVGATDTRGDEVTAGCSDGVVAGTWMGARLDTRVVVVLVVLGCECAEGAGSGEGAGVVAGAFCGLGPAACAAVIGTAAETTTTAAVRLILDHRAMGHGNGRC